MGKRPIRPGQLRRVSGIMMLSMAVGMLFALLFASFSIFLSVALLIGGFYFLFM